MSDENLRSTPLREPPRPGEKVRIYVHTKGRRAKDSRGWWAPACDVCGHPVDADTGLTTQDPRRVVSGHGRPCIACMRRETPKRDVAGRLLDEHRNTRGHDAPLPDETKRQMLERRKNESDVSFLLRQKAEENAERIVRPFFEALDLDAEETWDPRTKLSFFSKQVEVSMRVMDRVDGLPVQRQRQVDVEDEDVDLSTLPPGALDRLVMAAFADPSRSLESMLQLPSRRVVVDADRVVDVVEDQIVHDDPVLGGDRE